MACSSFMSESSGSSEVVVLVATWSSSSLPVVAASPDCCWVPCLTVRQRGRSRRSGDALASLDGGKFGWNHTTSVENGGSDGGGDGALRDGRNF